MEVFRFSLISDLFTSAILNIIFKISSEERVSDDTMIDPNYQKKVNVLFHNFSLNLTYIPVGILIYDTIVMP